MLEIKFYPGNACAFFKTAHECVFLIQNSPSSAENAPDRAMTFASKILYPFKKMIGLYLGIFAYDKFDAHAPIIAMT